MSFIEDLLELNYYDCVLKLKNKYGDVPYDYFVDESCNQKTKNNARGSDGLYIHHIDEDKAILLSTPEFAVKNSFEYQKANRLVYCNLLEHLVLHIKIIEYKNPLQNKDEICGVGGIYAFIVPELNDIYSGIKYQQKWKQKVCELILPLKNDYFLCIKKLVDLHFLYPLLTTFEFNSHMWKIENNYPLFMELIKLGVRK